MTHEDYKELLSASALNALDAAEARMLDAHLATCADCSSEMIEWQQTTALLALDVSPLEPSPELRERILAGVRAVREGRLDPKWTNDLAQPILSDDSRVSTFARTPGKTWTAPGSFGVFRSFGSLAASIVFVGLLISVGLLWRQNRSTQAELSKLSTQMREANVQLAREREAVELLTSPGARMAELAGTNSAPGAHAMLAYDKNGHAMLMAKGLPRAPAGMAYQLWFMMGNKSMPGKVFTPDAAGNGSLKDQIPAAALGLAVFAVTLEPEGGMPSPTGAVYLRSAV